MKDVKFLGKRLSASEFMKVPSEKFKVNAKYAWSAGIAMSRFLRELKEGRIIGRLCKKCRRLLVPPRMFCESCYRPTDEWVFLPGTGTIETFSISFIDTNAKPIKEPIFVGVIALDGAPPHCGFMHYFSEVSAEEIHIGMPVEPVWKPKEERIGAITDIRYFRPIRKKPRTATKKVVRRKK